MNEKKQRPLTKEIYHWVSSMRCAHVGENPNHIHFSSQNRRGTISFYEEYIIELSVEDRETGESLFYIHFAIQDIQKTKDNIRIFFRFLEGKDQRREQLDLPVIQKIRTLKVLVSCSCGITSSYFAFLMQQMLNQAGSGIQADAADFTKVDQIQDQYDYILLAPQISYLLPEFQKKYGDRVLAIDMVDFASRNVNHVLNLIVQKARLSA